MRALHKPSQFLRDGEGNERRIWANWGIDRSMGFEGNGGSRDLGGRHLGW